MIEIISCGTRHAEPPIGDLFLDAKLFPMPEPAARAGTGLDLVVQEQVWFGNPLATQCMDVAAAALSAIARVNGGAALVIACKDGRHRSVACAEWIAHRLVHTYSEEPDAVLVVHRDLGVAL